MTDQENCGYCSAIKELRAAEETPRESAEQQFEKRFVNMRATQLTAEQQTFDDDASQEIRALAEHRAHVKADLAQYEPPNIYTPKESNR